MPIRDQQHKISRQSPGDGNLEPSWRAAKDDAETLRQLLQVHGQKLLKAAARNAGPDEIAITLDAALEVEPKAEQIVLEHSALAGNAALFRWMLQHRMPEPDLSTMLRLYAVKGGVKIWKVLLEYNHKCINWGIGEHGDALGQAVLKRDARLVQFLLDEGSDVNESNFVGMPVLPAAKAMGASPEILDLLASHGAPE
ncbi:hypothetical protein LTR37_008925 [Vermiconidia calcicola]|uniref:Uncharacterized protein n=1 Tax=Vermiconidia calcicola TaxID=1690605 RepID=A0ACC3N9D7_9PEZI|nr:hypothetical protein LTR37_008925 [Vermiconidia calcicola]